MKYSNKLKTLSTMGFCVLALSLQACQSNEPSTSTVASNTSDIPSETDAPKTSELDASTRPPVQEITYVATNIDPVPGQLTSQYADSKINVRSQPSTRSSAPHFGYKGDAVTLLKQADGEGGKLWYYLRFDQSKAEGWVRSDFVAHGRLDKPGNDPQELSLLPQSAYRPFDLQADPWLKSFNQSYTEAIENQADWVRNPQLLAQQLTGFSRECPPESLSTVKSSNANQVTVLLRKGSTQGELCAGDSVADAEYRVDLISEGPIWKIDWSGGRFRCWPGRGQQAFAPKLCL